MGEMKSAWEIAQEKAERLGELTLEERRQQQEGKCNLIGEALANKYLSSFSPFSLPEEINKYEDEERKLVTRVVLSRLIGAIELGRDSLLERVSQGILSLREKKEIGDIITAIEETFQQHREAGSEKRQEIERAGREILHKLRISGTAIGEVNSQTREEWRSLLKEITQPFEERLTGLKQQLSDLALD